MRLADQLRTTTFLLTLRYMVLFFVSVTILAGIFNWVAIGYIEQEADGALDAEITGLREQMLQRGPAGLAQLVTARSAANPNGDTLYLIADENFAPLAGNLKTWPNLSQIGESRAVFSYTEADGSTVPVRARLLLPQSNLRMIVGRKVQALNQLSKLFDRTLFWGLGVTLALAMMGGLLMSANVLRRVNAFNATSRRIMEGDLSQRMSTSGSGDEFDELARNLNAMMEQIEKLMLSIQHISDNVAHDLRTPLTRLRSRLEELRLEAAGEQAEEIDACLDDADGLLATFSSLLSIARIESGSYDADREPVDLSRLARDAYEFYKALADDKSITFSCDAPGEVLVNGDRNLLFQAITNLLDNAIKYTPGGGDVAISLQRDQGQPLLCVSDTGPGIPAEMRDKVLDRFFRLDKSRSEPGAGLGLSLVVAIAKRHAAELELDDNKPGLIVRLRFPLP